jgi:predicted AAA+ superfamily ATPase
MVFVGGPRQVGKTTFALTFLPEPHEKNPAYLNWDDVLTRSSLMRGELPPNQDMSKRQPKIDPLRQPNFDPSMI